MTENKRIFGLDLLRAVAILSVVFAHGEALLPSEFNLLHRIFVFDGVTIFFVLSGFLIGGIVIKDAENKRFNLINFWKRRWFRTLPNYFLILFLLLFLQSAFGDLNPLDYKRYFVFSQNFISPHPRFFPEAWSLSVEEWFYIILPIIFYCLVKRFTIKESLIATCVAVILFSTSFRIYQYFTIDIATLEVWDKHFRKLVSTRLDSISWGVLGAFFSFYYKEKWTQHKKGFFVSGIFLLVAGKAMYLLNIIPINSFEFSVLRLTADSLATLMLLPFLSNLKRGKGIMSRSITFISLTSYSMYLIHYSFIQYWIINNLNWAGLGNGLATSLNYIIYWGLTIILSYLLYKYFEVPMTNLRELKFSKFKNVLLIGVSQDK